MVQRVCLVGGILIRHPYDEDVLIGTLHIVLLTSHLLKCLGVIVQTLELACGSIETLLVVGYLAPEFGNPLPTAAPDEQAVVIEPMRRAANNMMNTYLNRQTKCQTENSLPIYLIIYRAKVAKKWSFSAM